MDTSSGDDEAPKDPGAHQAHLQGYTELDFQGNLQERCFFLELFFHWFYPGRFYLTSFQPIFPFNFYFANLSPQDTKKKTSCFVAS